ncbi:hypothetical protein YC2023_017808 [Brassica napus]
MKEEQWAPVIVMLISSVAMGSVNALVKKALDVGVNHMIFAAYRMSISGLILVPFSYIWERKTRPMLTFMLLCEHFISGLLGASLMQFFFLLGLSYTSPTVAMALNSMLPAITFALALIFRIENAQKLKSRAGVLKLIGTLICILGAMFLTFYKGLQVSNPHSHPEAIDNITLHNNGHDQAKKWLLGCVYLFTGIVLLSLWMLFQGKLSVKYPCTKYSSTCLMSVFAAFQCAILSLYKSREIEDWIIKDKLVIFVILYAVSFSVRTSIPRGQPLSARRTIWYYGKLDTPIAWPAVRIRVRIEAEALSTPPGQPRWLKRGIVGQAMSTVVTSWSIKRTGAVFVSTFSPVSLVSATLFDFLILRSPLYLGSIIGSVVTITGLNVFLWGKRSETDQTVSKILTTSKSCQMIENEDNMTVDDNNTKLPRYVGSLKWSSYNKTISQQVGAQIVLNDAYARARPCLSDERTSTRTKTLVLAASTYASLKRRSLTGGISLAPPRICRISSAHSNGA